MRYFSIFSILKTANQFKLCTQMWIGQFAVCDPTEERQETL